MLVEGVLSEDHLVAVDVEHSSCENVVPDWKFVKWVTRLSLDPVLELMEYFRDDLVLTLEWYIFAC